MESTCSSYRLGHTLEQELKRVVPSIYATKSEFLRAAIILTIIIEKKDILDLLLYDKAFNVSDSIRTSSLKVHPRVSRLFKGYYFRMMKKNPQLINFPTKSQIFRMCCWHLLSKF